MPRVFQAVGSIIGNWFTLRLQIKFLLIISTTALSNKDWASERVKDFGGTEFKLYPTNLFSLTTKRLSLPKHISTKKRKNAYYSTLPFPKLGLEGFFLYPKVMDYCFFSFSRPWFFERFSIIFGALYFSLLRVCFLWTFVVPFHFLDDEFVSYLKDIQIVG